MPFFEIRNLHVGRGEETPQFDGIITIRDREVCRAFNHGRGGANIYHWIEPFNAQWAREKLFPLASKHAAEIYPDTHIEGSAALDVLVFDYVDITHAKLKKATPRTTISPSISPATSQLKVGAIVLFGRPNGEKTKGKVIKVNRKSVTVETLEHRGRHSSAGAKWKVAPSLLTVVG